MQKEFQRRFDDLVAAREVALQASRRAIRSSANSIRAIHRGEMEEAHRLMEEARASLEEGKDGAAQHPEVRYGGYLQDAEKEYVEARVTEAIVSDVEAPGPDDMGVGLAPFLGGMAEAVGEARRNVLDLLRQGEVEPAERVLGAMEDVYAVLVTMDYPDAITGNLRRSTDVARSLLEKTRGDLTNALVQRDLKLALERHADRFQGEDPA